MVFAWSSCAAQYVMTSSVLTSGVHHSQFLGDEHTLPPRGCTAYSAATDDVLAFEVGPCSGMDNETAASRKALDKVWEEDGIVSKREKATDSAMNGTALGIDLIQGRDMNCSRRARASLTSSPALMISSTILRVRSVSWPAS